MKDRGVGLNGRVRSFMERMHADGVKLTPQRLEIFREIVKSGEHPDAERIYRSVHKRIPTLSRDTVYRNLWALFDLGLITTVGPPRKSVRFDGDMSAHHHFICTGCGLISDFRDERLDNLAVGSAERVLAVVERTQVEVRGVCKKCQSGPATRRKKEKR